MRPLFEHFVFLMVRRLQQMLRSQGAVPGGSGGALMGKRTDIESILIIGSGPIVIGQPANLILPAPRRARRSRGGLPRHPRQFEPGHDHDGPGDGRPDLHRADHLANSRPDHREGAARRAAADPGGQTGSTRRSPLHEGVLEEYGVEMIGAKPRGHPHGRGPRTVPQRHARHRPRDAPSPDIAHDLDEALARAGRSRIPDRDPAFLHARRHEAAGSPSTARSSRRS